MIRRKTSNRWIDRQINHRYMEGNWGIPDEKNLRVLARSDSGLTSGGVDIQSTDCIGLPRAGTSRTRVYQSFGLTLFELVIVLAILAAMAAAASVATDRMLLRRRNEVTDNTLAAFRNSLLGRFGRVDQIAGISTAQSATEVDGFIADVGRLPVAVGADPELQLSELWVNPNGIETYGLKTAAGDPEVTLACGWRGPYLDLAIGSARLKDGYGRSLVVLAADATGIAKVAASGETIMGLSSLGSDGATGVTSTELPLGEDRTVWLGDSMTMIKSDLTVSVFESDGAGGRLSPTQSGSLMVRLYLPDASNGGLTWQQSPVIATPGAAAFSFPDALIGKKVLRAYWVSDDASISVNSAVSPIEVRRNGETNFELLLPPLPESP